MLASYILLIGEELIKGGQKADLLPKYNAQLKVYKESGGRPSKEPTIWKLDKSPSKK